MELLVEVVKFIVYSVSIILISKYVLVFTIRRLAQYLNLSSKTVGNVAGLATSVPEFLTVIASSINGLMSTTMYNILSSNIINFLQYMASIFVNKNQTILKNQAVKIDIFLVVMTIIIPVVLIISNIQTNIFLVVLFAMLYIVFKYIDRNAHKLYLEKEVEKNIKTEKKRLIKSIKYIILLIISGILLFVIGDLLGDTLENLCYTFNIPELIIGVLLGLITSLPELITFIEAQKHHKKADDELSGVIEATNNLFTSNIINLFVIQSVGVLIYRIFA